MHVGGAGRVLKLVTCSQNRAQDLFDKRAFTPFLWDTLRLTPITCTMSYVDVHVP